MTLVIALLIDAVLGEPKWLWDRIPHPAVLMGRVIGWFDGRFNNGDGQFGKGALGLLAMCVGIGVLGAIIRCLPLGWLLEILIVAALVAQKSLASHVQEVADALRISVEQGRSSVAKIVGRDTKDMEQSAIARAAIESAAENFSDGVVAPVFWFLVAGLPGILIYKFVNTADSMIGYRTPKHELFGKFAARLDDGMNWIPARLTAGLIVVVYGAWELRFAMSSEARKHRSPNAGWPETAMARILGVALSGPRAYEGQMRDFPWVNASGLRDIGPKEIDGAVDVLWRAWLGLLVFCLVVAIIC